MATIKDVARRAQVSTATVSYVLNGTGVVSEPTRARVLAAVAELGYQPNHSARALRTRSHTIGIVAPGIAGRLADPATAELLAGLSEAATTAGYCLLIASPTAAESEDELALRLARSGRVDGLVVFDLRRDDERPARLAAAGVPTIAIGARLPVSPARLPVLISVPALNRPSTTWHGSVIVALPSSLLPLISV